MLDLPTLLQPIPGAAPAGPNLDSREDYLEFERATVGKPERQVGAKIVPAEPPDWSFLIKRSSELLGESKDLRIAVQLVRALVQTRSFAGLGEGLSLIRQLIDNFWDGLHPELDPDDKSPQLRVTAMMALTHRDMIQMLRSAPLVRSRAFGSASLRELDAAATARGDEAAGMVASLEAVFREVELGELATAAGSVEQCDHEAASLVTVWSRRAGADASAVDFAEFRKVLAQANSVMKQRLEQRQPVLAAPASAASPAAPAASHEAFSLRGELRTREDVVKALDGVCAYYARHEPSSPVPLLVERCKRLVSMSFLEIVKDMMPDGLSAIQTIAGKQDAET